MRLRTFHLSAEFDDGPGECGSGGAYVEKARTPEDAVRKLLSTLGGCPTDIEVLELLGVGEYRKWVWEGSACRQVWPHSEDCSCQRCTETKSRMQVLADADMGAYEQAEVA
jgi:hypothetical protein